MCTVVVRTGFFIHNSDAFPPNAPLHQHYQKHERAMPNKLQIKQRSPGHKGALCTFLSLHTHALVGTPDRTQDLVIKWTDLIGSCHKALTWSSDGSYKTMATPVQTCAGSHLTLLTIIYKTLT